jgi:hypothetical protein
MKDALLRGRRSVGRATMQGRRHHRSSDCGDRSTSSTCPPLGRSLGAEPTPASPAPAPTGDPPAERGGTIPQSQAAQESRSPSGSLARSPQAALRGYALAYTNWQASNLPAHERELASLAVGAARLAAEQTAASQSATANLAANHVRNKGVVLAIAPGQGPARRRWLAVTQEQTSRTGSYADLPCSPHVTLARVTPVGQGWAVSEWRPSS